MNILICNRGLSALKFIIGLKDWFSESDNIYNIKLYGFVTEVDIKANYKYIPLLDYQIYLKNNNIYNNADDILSYCKQYNINAVFPGWGYLSENADFVELLEKNNILFIGPTSYSMKKIGDKIKCNQIADELKVPTLPWSGETELKNIDDVTFWCEKIGYPVMLKAGNSGGGKGIRIVKHKSDIQNMFNEIYQEVKDPLVYATKYIEKASHLEIQVVADGENAIHLHGRDCTTQRRNQKLVEECPITKIDDSLINSIQNYATQMMSHVKYRGLATVEFIYDQLDNKVYILEVNPRIQVEHIITEQLFDLNLIKILFLVANGTKLQNIPELLNIDYSVIKKKHVMSIRINSENPYENFKPIQGIINHIEMTLQKQSWGYFSMHNNGEISGETDSQFGHLLVWANNRQTCIKKLETLISHTKIKGSIFNTCTFLRNYITNDVFFNNKHYTQYLHNIMMDDLLPTEIDPILVHFISIVYLCHLKILENSKKCIESINNGHTFLLKNINSWNSGYSLFQNKLCDYSYIYKITSDNDKILLLKINNILYKINYMINNNVIYIYINNKLYKIHHSYFDKYNIELLVNQYKYIITHQLQDSNLISPVSGKIKELCLKDGDFISQGLNYVKIECMKMIITFQSNTKGTIFYKKKVDDTVVSGEVIAEIKNDDEIKEEKTFDTIDSFVSLWPASDSSVFKDISDFNNSLIHTNPEMKNTYVNPSSYPSYFSDYFIPIKKDVDNIAMHGWIINDKNNNNLFVLVSNDLKLKNGVFGFEEDYYFCRAISYAIENKLPFVFIASNSGAEISINDKLKFIAKPSINFLSKSVDYLYLDSKDFSDFKNDVIAEYIPSKDHYKLKAIVNSGIMTLDGSACLVSKMAKARTVIPTFTIVIDRTIGVGAYLAKLSERIIQRSDSPLLLTGFQALNKVIGNNLYESNIQLGGPLVMANNGISHKVVDTTHECIEYTKKWLDFIIYKQTNIKAPSTFFNNETEKTVHSIIDCNSFMETMSEFAKTVRTGRCRIGGHSFGLIYNDPDCQPKFIPCDPSDLDSSKKIIMQSPNVLYPDTSYKISKTIQNVAVEGLPLLIIANWRGFSGGTRDMYNNVLDFGSMIVSELSSFTNKIYLYIPEHAQLRGGSMVVFSKSINPTNISFCVHQNSNINVLEPNATKELKFKTNDEMKYSNLYNLNSSQSSEAVNMFMNLNDVVHSQAQILGRFGNVIDNMLTTSELRDLIIKNN
jgi:biotin carboxylase/acetyl-CoA carboxylase carboxyltransferase component